MVQASWENVLVLQTSFLGDTVLTLPLIAEIKRRFPVKKLSIVCSPMARELLQDYPAIDDIIVDNKKNGDRGFAGLRRRAATLESKKFTLALTPHKSLRSALLLRLADIPYRVGFRQSSGWFLFHERAERDPKRHDVERNLSILEPFGVNVEGCLRQLDLPVSAAVQSAVDQKLAALGVVENKTIIGINSGSVWPTKRWWPKGFARLIQLLKQRIDCHVVLFGGAEDAAVVAEVQEMSNVPVVNLAGKIGLRELPAAIGRCQIFVTNDSGPMHIAVARQVPTVAVFCATNPDLGFYPYTHDAIVLGKPLACRPCASHGGRRCPLGSEECIRQIQPEKVLAAVEKLLTTDRSGRDPSVQDFHPEFMAA